MRPRYSALQFRIQPWRRYLLSYQSRGRGIFLIILAPLIFDQIDLLSLPAAGVRVLDLLTESSWPSRGFDDIENNHFHLQVESNLTPPSEIPGCLTRTYGSESDILNAYYDFIHDNFPILPPRNSQPSPDQPLNIPLSYESFQQDGPLLVYRPASPLSLALSAILALIPHPDDPAPLSENSVTQRRAYAQKLATLASAKVESDCDLESSSELGEALSTQRCAISRTAFHEYTPVDLESLLSLLVLSIYEYAQRGNLLKMRSRVNQALAIAMGKSLHCCTLVDQAAEARRRAWWMTPLTIDIEDPEFTTPYPKFSSDEDCWSILIQAQQVLVSATQYVIDLDKALSMRTNLQPILKRMETLDSWAHSVLTVADQLQSSVRDSDGAVHGEIVTARTIRIISKIKLSSAQIKIHRFRAFSDIPIFIKKHCDLTVAYPDKPQSSTKPETGALSCSCSSLKPLAEASAMKSYEQPDGYTPGSSIPQNPNTSYLSGFPFSTQHSTQVCFSAAILMSKLFQGLPSPQPLRNGYHQQTSDKRELPRTMPSFACCLMQSSYALLMLFYKARVAVGDGKDTIGGLGPSTQLINELQNGLKRIIDVSSNYSQSFEALIGMRGTRFLSLYTYKLLWSAIRLTAC
ncbi:unnamed protein product [Penicillium salamii]|uniref:Transcription factor domain-containing protein n=1 Tax=Penicillium salamii TaxID=1612424 RepID=A0A9W4NKK0_9EURO|nr:unnamed protein product [Penicillium salamii]CAG7976334.1 unnamed protein product [Penicillium salamii]CAG8034362.1 unnamed protein product [Penicillium salamii]CAG8057503.1 unnamed protein product [Penicillium salamii]CAG8143280.1 unnamed protein product [Penicillium salamii]